MMLRGKVAIVTGATGALGLDTVRVFLQEGAKVAGCDVEEMRIDEMIPDAALRERCVGVRADLTTESGAAHLIAHTLERFGQVDILINVVGGWKGGLPVAQTSLEDWEAMFALNLRTAFLCTRAVLPHMLERTSGRIVNISSRGAVDPPPGQAAYNAAKAGVIAFTQTLSEEVKERGITVNCVLPSILDTEANRRAIPTADFTSWVTPADLARVLAFLASDGASQITGAAIPAYGRA